MGVLLGGSRDIVLGALGLAAEGAVVLDLLLALLLLSGTDGLLNTLGHSVGGVARRKSVP